MVHDMDKGLSLARRVHPKYRPVFDKLSEADRAAVARTSCRTLRKRTLWKSPGLGSSSGTVLSPISRVPRASLLRQRIQGLRARVSILLRRRL